MAFRKPAHHQVDGRWGAYLIQMRIQPEDEMNTDISI
jgi:hypothetical protein